MIISRSIDKRRGKFLPHWTQEGATYFVTFRLTDSMPKDLADQYRNERKRLLAEAETASGSERERILRRAQHIITGEFDALLDEGRGGQWLAHPGAADIVANALKHFDGERYRLWAYCVMPNHVHVVVEPIEEMALSSILHSWKSYTANRINSLLERTGRFWQLEYFDHLVRNAESFEYFVQYTVENPAKAGLKDWKWVGKSGNLPQ